jgi:pimeloyl-ACP methyl ester carboxylesterase
MRARADLIELRGADPTALRRIDTDLVALEHERDELSRQTPFIRWLASWFPPVRDAMHGMDRTLDELDSAIGDRQAWAGRQILAYDGSGDGRIVEVFGDLRSAHNIAVLVPGVGTDLDTYEDVFSRDAQTLAERLHATDSAVIAWLGYDAPDSVVMAATESPAVDGAAALATFVASLPPAHVTVVGHSYGSLVVGLAARDQGMVADELVFIGSPGVGADTAPDLHLPGSAAVWSGLTPFDPIHLARPGCLTKPDRCLSEPGVIFGTDPYSAAFNARTFDTGSAPVWNAHSAYYAPGTKALDNIARIVTGDDDRVSTR